MTDVLLRNVAPDDLDAVRRRARRHKRSVQAELKQIIADTVARERDREVALAFAATMRAKLEGTISSDTTELIREDRDR